MTQSVKKRQSRLFRSPNPRPIQLTERRLAELDILYRHRLATTDIFQAVLPGSDRRIQIELRDVWNAGYIDRPLEQFSMHIKHKGGHGRSEIIYALANKGMNELIIRNGYDKTKTDLNRKNQELGETTIFHDVGLTKLWACLKAACEQKARQKKNSYGLVFWYQDRSDREQLKTEIILPNAKKLNLIPDAAFKFQNPFGQYLFLVEYYRTRKGGHSTYLDKLKIYNLYHKQQKFKKYRIKKGFRIITVAPSSAVVENLIKLINSKREYESLRHFRFWFVSEEDYRLYLKERVPGKNYFKKTLDVQSILKPIFRTPINDKRYGLEDCRV